MNTKIETVVVEPVEIFTIHSTYQQLSSKDKRRTLKTLIKWSIKEWIKNW
jgi:hypothetical protein